MTLLNAEKERRVRYSIQVKPGTARLVAEFPEGQDELLGRFIDLLLPEEKRTEGKALAAESKEFAVIVREK